MAQTVLQPRGIITQSQILTPNKVSVKGHGSHTGIFMLTKVMQKEPLGNKFGKQKTGGLTMINLVVDLFICLFVFVPSETSYLGAGGITVRMCEDLRSDLSTYIKSQAWLITPMLWKAEAGGLLGLGGCQPSSKCFVRDTVSMQ